VLIEHHLPLTSKRVDAILAGAHPKTGAPSYVVIALKQWSGAEQYEDGGTLMLVDGYPTTLDCTPRAGPRPADLRRDRNDGPSSPCSCSQAIHSASLTPDFRPGTAFRCVTTPELVVLVGLQGAGKSTY
jgi:hypothetical protein